MSLTAHVIDVFVSEASEALSVSVLITNIDMAANGSTINMDNLIKIHTPTTLGVYGPTQCGKTRFVLNLLKEGNKLFTKRIQDIYYCYEVYQECYDELKQLEDHGVDKVVFNEGMPSIELCREWAFMKSHIVIVFDDLMTV